MNTGYFGDKYNGRTAVYRLYDRTGQLLYIGITCDLDERWHQHHAEKYWWRDVERKDIVWVNTRDEARAIEYKATRIEKPLYDRLDRNGRLSEEEKRALEHQRVDRAAEAIKRDIRSGVFPAGVALPSVRELMERCDESSAVVRSALWHLRENARLLARVHGNWVVYNPLARVDGLHAYDDIMYLMCRDAFGYELFTIHDVHERTKITKATITKCLHKIKDAGLAETVRRGRGGKLWWSCRAEPLPNPDLRPVPDFFDHLF